MKIQLHGSNGTRQVDLQPPAETAKSKTDELGKNFQRRAAFAAMSALKPLLPDTVTVDDIWTHFKSVIEVESRSEFTEKQWATIAARLNSAKRDEICRAALVSQCKKESVPDVLERLKSMMPQCRVYRTNDDGKQTTVYEGELTKDIHDRCRKHANATGCRVRLVCEKPDLHEIFYPDSFGSDMPVGKAKAEYPEIAK